MEREQGLYFNVGELTVGRADELNFNIDWQAKNFVDKELNLVSPITGKVRFIALEDGVLGTFTAEATLTLVCSIDGKEYESPMYLEFQNEFSPGADDPTNKIRPNQTVDIGTVIRDEILVNIPMKPLCPKHLESS